MARQLWFGFFYKYFFDMIFRLYQWIKNRFFAPVGVENKALAKRVINSGQVVWEADLDTFNVQIADVEKVSYYDSKGKRRIRNKVLLKTNCIYEFAINGENAVRKFEKRIVEYHQKKTK